MATNNLLKGKRVLIVDDEPDVLEALYELLKPVCEVIKANDFVQARSLLEAKYYDIVILDIMGVRGYELLNIAINKKMIAVMLTAHAQSPEHIMKSFERGAASYLPKEEMDKIELFLNDLLVADKMGKHFWSGWLDKWSAFYDKKFGPDWQKDNEDFWQKISYL